MQRVLAFFILAASSMGGAKGAGPVHGPFCTWHIDPTSTMTIQWVERVNVPVPSQQWFESAAGFGYGDDDDHTVLAMQDKFPRLYVRKAFEIKDLPTVPEFDPSGQWVATATVDKRDVQVVLDLKSEDGKLSGTVQREGSSPAEIKNGYVSGKSIYMEFDVVVGILPLSVSVTGKQDDNDANKISGQWSAKGLNGKELAKDDVNAARQVQEGDDKPAEEKKEGASEEQKDEKKEEKKVVNPEAFELILKVRYDDAFIAYLNGQEIYRKGVKSGSGASAEGIESHDADPEKDETFSIDKKLNRLLHEGSNIIAIEGHNANLDSSDFTLDPKFFVKIGNDEKKLVDEGARWQFHLGEPESDWSTKVDEDLTPPPALGNLVSPFHLRYGERGQPLNREIVSEVFEFGDTRQPLHRGVLRGLKADTGYAFTIHEEGRSERLKNQKWFFRTAPASATESLTFVTGGDMFHKRDLLDAMNRRCAQSNPLFALLGGDLAYANGKDANKWYDWLDSWSQWSVTVEDYLVPMVLVIGNHECSLNIDEVKKEEQESFKPAENAKFFFSLFPLPEGRTNYVLDFADYMSIIALDSNHTQTPESQAPWLESVLKQRRNVANLFACYHRPAYGTLVKDDETEVRKHWTPLFEKYGVDVAFENDHHIYKRTHPIINGAVDSAGVLYLGDGAWGVDLRDVPWDKARSLEYIATASKVNHLIKVTLTEEAQRFDALDASGNRIDSHLRFRP